MVGLVKDQFYFRPLSELLNMSLPLIITIILNTNRCEDTLACLASLRMSLYPQNKIIVLDNSSTDGSVEAIHNRFPEVQIISLEENLGYAGNNNVGVELAIKQDADWVFVLNEDTVLDSECISRLIEVGESDPKIGVVGPMVYHYDEPDIIQSAGGMLGPYWESIHLAKNEKYDSQFIEPHSVEWISGCAIMVKRDAINQVGMIDQRFFYYWEETEWCMRIGKAGWRIIHVPSAKIWHKGVQRNYHPKPSVTYYSTRNRLLMLAKHQASLRVWIYSWFQILRTLTSWTIKPKWRCMREHKNAMLRGLLDFFSQRWGQMPD
jgi:GT2 family glycosyltransferase